MPPATATYERHKARAGERQRANTRAGQDIGKIPAIKDRRRRKYCIDDFELYCRTYHASVFNLPWADYHKSTAAKIQETVEYGGWYARALPRGGGKTTLCKCGILWAILRGSKRYPVIVAATEAHAKKLLHGIKMQLFTNPLLLEDFPHAVYPIRKLRNQPRAAGGQLYKGKLTFIEWGQDRIVFPWIDERGSLSKGAVIEAFGIESASRGLTCETPRGDIFRPDLALADDPQTRAALDVDTLIPTPSGFVRMGDLSVGNKVFDENGRQCLVTGTSEVYCDHECYIVAFDDGSRVIADAGHLWVTSTALQRTNARRRHATPMRSESYGPQYATKPLKSVVTTEEIAATLIGEGGRNNHSIPMPNRLDTARVHLPIPPYTLGAWLGDGHSGSNRITTADEGILDEIRADGFGIGKRCAKPDNAAADYSIKGLRRLLTAYELLNNKHIPHAYLFASANQRLELLQGLMDTDGCASVAHRGVKGCRCGFSNTNRKLIHAVLHLCRSLGIKAKATFVPQRTKRNRAPAWNVSFVTDQPVFRLPRKLSRLPVATKPSTRRRYVVSVTATHSRPVRCITVDSPSNMYLCGEEFIPTHNSAKSPSQTNTRLEYLTGDVAYLPGPGESMAVFCPCTVMYEGDLADQILNRDKHPEWDGERTKMVERFPDDMSKWDAYADVARAEMLESKTIIKSTAFYKADQVAMDAGCIVTWPDRYDRKKGEISAIQHAMNFKIRNEAAFYAECQNEPIIAQDDLELISVDELCDKVTNYPRGVVPDECSVITAFTDEQMEHLFWMVCGWMPDFTGFVLDYGAWPEQKRNYFTRRDVRKKLSMVYDGDESGIMFGALTELGRKLAGQSYQTHSGKELRLSRWLIDGNWRSREQATRAYAKQSEFANIITLSYGRGVKAAQVPFSEAQRAIKWRTGPGWFWSDGPGPARGVVFDTNLWKKRVHNALSLSVGSRGSIQLFKAPPQVHRMLADHLLAEKPTKTEANGRTVYEWREIPGRDNEWLDCLVGCALGASICGIMPDTERVHKARTVSKSLQEWASNAKSK